MKKIKKIIHIIAIEYPIVTILLVVTMVTGLMLLCNTFTVDKYYEQEGIIVLRKNDGIGTSEMIVPIEYYEGISHHQHVIWYVDLESKVYSGKINSIEVVGDECRIIIETTKKDFENEVGNSNGELKANFKISYSTESILQRLMGE